MKQRTKIVCAALLTGLFLVGSIPGTGTVTVYAEGSGTEADIGSDAAAKMSAAEDTAAGETDTFPAETAVKSSAATENTESAAGTETADAAESAESAAGTETADAAESTESAAESEEAVIEYVDVPGDVQVIPTFTWEESGDGEKAAAGFTLRYEVENRSGMAIPETEIRFSLPESAGFSFREESLDSSGTAVQSGSEMHGSSVHVFRIADLQPGERRVMTVHGAASEDAARLAGNDLNVDIILRGYGLEHRSGGSVPIPEYAFVKPVQKIPQLPKPAERVISILVANLSGKGRNPVTAELAEEIPDSRQILARQNVTEKRDMHFLDVEAAADAEPQRPLLPETAAVLIGFFVFALSGRILNAVSIRKTEQERKFRRR